MTETELKQERRDDGVINRGGRIQANWDLWFNIWGLKRNYWGKCVKGKEI